MGRSRQIQKNEETKQAILNTALELGMEYGFESLSIRKITDKLGYSPGIIYYYFKDKQEIIDAIHADADKVIVDNITKLYQKDRGLEYNIRTIFHMIMQIALEEPEKYRLIVFDKYLNRKESKQRWLDMVAYSIQLGIQTGELRNVDSRVAAINVWSAFFGLLIVINGYDNITRDYAEKLFDNHLAIIMKGLKTQ